MILAVPALAIPSIAAGAGARVSVTPSETAAGSTVRINGIRFTPSNRVILVLEGDIAPSRVLTVGDEGTFSSFVWLPSTTKPGAYRIEVRSIGARALGQAVLARSTLLVNGATDDAARAASGPDRMLEKRDSSTRKTTTAKALITPPSLPPPTPEPTPAPATPAPVTPPPATPAPQPAQAAATPVPQAALPSISGRAFFIAPGGNDSAAGSIDAPWRTIARASAALGPGDVLYARGGVYTGQGGYNWATTASGTAAAPITFAAYTGEAPVLDGTWSIGNGLILADVGHVVVRGLKFTHYDDQWGGAPILLLRAHDIVIEGSTFIDNGRTPQQDHHIYINSGCWNLVIRNNYMQGTPGAAVHIYHDPGPTNVVIAGNTMIGGYWGVVVGSLSNTIAMNSNTFSGNVVNMELTTNSPNVTATGNSPNNVIN